MSLSFSSAWAAVDRNLTTSPRPPPDGIITRYPQSPHKRTILRKGRPLLRRRRCCCCCHRAANAFGSLLKMLTASWLRGSQNYSTTITTTRKASLLKRKSPNRPTKHRGWRQAPGCLLQHDLATFFSLPSSTHPLTIHPPTPTNARQSQAQPVPLISPAASLNFWHCL